MCVAIAFKGHHVFANLFSNDPPRPWRRRFFYRSVQFCCQMVFLVFYRVRIHNIENLPLTGASLLCSNHQSNLDPIAIGLVAPRRVSFLAKKSLFKFPLGLLLRPLECIAIDRDAVGVGGMKETLRRLKRSETVLLFPEGTRSLDGELQPFMNGFCVLARRVKAPVIPVGIEGPFDCWPSGSWLPKPGHIHMVVGAPIEYSEMEGLSDQEITVLLQDRIGDCFGQARAHYRRNR